MRTDLVVFFIAAVLITLGILILVIGVIGIFRIKYVLNRLHSAAMLDSLGLFLIALGVMVIKGFSYDSAKLLVMICLFWIASPICSHLLTSLEVATNKDYKKDARVVRIEELEEEEE